MERIKRALEKARSEAAAANRSLLPQTRVVEPALGRQETKNLRAEVEAPLEPKILARNRIIKGDKGRPGTVAFDLLRTRVLRAMREKGWRTLGVTSPGPGCGKTTVAINLALSIAQLPAPRVLLVDLDLRRPKVAEYLGLALERDLSDYIEGRLALSSIFVDPGVPRLLVLPIQKAYENATEMLTTTGAQELLPKLKALDDQVVFVIDLPPVLNTDETIAFLPQLDCVLLVVAERLTRKADIEAALRVLEGANLLGTLLNNSKANQLSYY